MSGQLQTAATMSGGWTAQTRIDPDHACRVLFRLMRIAAAQRDVARDGPCDSVLAVHPYTAPERLRDAPPDELTEVYAFGALLYNMLTGVQPFAADDPIDLVLRIVASDAPRITTHVPSLPEALADVVARALSRDRAVRIPNVLALAEALAPFTSARLERSRARTARAPPLRQPAPGVGSAQPVTRARRAQSTRAPNAPDREPRAASAAAPSPPCCAERMLIALLVVLATLLALCLYRRPDGVLPAEACGDATSTATRAP